MFGKKMLRASLLGGAASTAILFAAGAANAQQADFNISPQPLASALNVFSQQSRVAIIFTPQLTDAKLSRGISGATDVQVALNELLAGTGLSWRKDGSAYVIVSASDPQSGSAAGDGADQGTVAALVVTAQKREENIQDVPIAMSAFTQEDLTRSQVTGGPDLMTQIPNFTFTKTNFSSYSIQIRGIGTQAISATVDPAVAVAFNNTPFIRNRFFEQEFFDLERVEVLRGPQGTLYGRNATAGVVNIISAKPKFHYEAKLSGDVANYSSTRLEGMVNLPLVEDKVALRIAGAWTKRDGFVTNELTGNQVDGRDLWSTRVTLGLEPTDHIRANLIWEHFQENDDRLRSGKQLCHRDPNPTSYLGIPVDTTGSGGGSNVFTSQGCRPASLYSAESFEVPNGYALPYYGGAAIITPAFSTDFDVYESATQSRDLRAIQTQIKPEYKAKNDVVELQAEIDVGPHLTLASETSYGHDAVFSFEDFNRFNTRPGVFNPNGHQGDLAKGILDQNGVFCDPQLGCSDRLLGADLSTGKAEQFSQELRISSNFEGALNFSIGANFLRSTSVDKYYVFFNSLTLFSLVRSLNQAGDAYPNYIPGVSDNSQCLTSFLSSDPFGAYGGGYDGCRYVDPNPIHSLNDLGRNYFLSKNPYRLISYAVFGEMNYQIASDLKVTLGARWTVDKKHTPLVPSWLLAQNSYGLPVSKVYDQKWSKPTGRAVLQWKPHLAFTDDTLIYASYAHGYKAGGVNPPPPVNAFSEVVGEYILANQPQTFKPEYVNAVEIGSKNTLMDGRLTLNGDVFNYDYSGYQISQIVNRSAVNLNFDARIWGAELELEWRPIENLRLGLKQGYEKTRLADGSSAIDTMDRTAGHTDWMVVKPYPTDPSNCIVPTYVAATLASSGDPYYLYSYLGISGGGACTQAYFLHNDPLTGAPYVPNPELRSELSGYGYPGFDPLTAPNNGQGFSKNLSGKELPNAPHFTTTITADYTLPLANNWLLTLHTDLYRQSEAWSRVFNMAPYDRLKPYTNVNVAAIFTNEDAGWQIMAYVKNALDKDNITGAFLNSDDTGLTTNVFLNEPRIYGVRVSKQWSSEWPAGGGRNHPSGAPYPFMLELGGAIDRTEASGEIFVPAFVDSLSSNTNPTGIQNSRMDWGSSGEAKLTYTPEGRSWHIAAGVRYGKANRQTQTERSEVAADTCGFSPPYDTVCEKYPQFQVHALNYGTSTVFDHEDFKFADFSVGKDAKLGLLGEGASSTVDLALRYAQFDSRERINLRTNGGWYVAPSNPYFKYAQHTRASASLDATREFKGAGPVLSWDVSKAFVGNDESGRVSVEWRLSGGILLGDQRTRLSHSYRTEYYSAPYYQLAFYNPAPVLTTAPPPTELSRTKFVTVPILGASLGLSYDVQRVKVSAGYRVDKAYKVIDGGVDAHRSYDRIIQGPYFKISVGFGG